MNPSPVSMPSSKLSITRRSRLTETRGGSKVWLAGGECLNGVVVIIPHRFASAFLPKHRPYDPQSWRLMIRETTDVLMSMRQRRNMPVNRKPRAQLCVAKPLFSPRNMELQLLTAHVAM